MIRPMSGILGVAFLGIVSAAAAADDWGGVKLMRPDSLVGWDYGEQSPAGWTIRDGRLSGTADATPLLSGY